MAMSRISAVFESDVSGLTAGSREASAALKALSGDVGAFDSAMKKLGDAGAVSLNSIGPAATVASAAVRRLNVEAIGIEAAWRSGTLTIGEYQTRLNALARDASAVSDSVARGAAVTRQFTTEQTKLNADLLEYAGLRRQGVISEETYAAAVGSSVARLRELASLAGQNTAAYREEQAALSALTEARARADAITRSTLNADEQQQAAIGELLALRDAGVLGEVAYARAMEQTNETYRRNAGLTAAAADAERERQTTMARGEAVIRSLMTAEQQHEAEITELSGLLAAGAINHDQYRAAVERTERTAYEASDAYRAQQQAMRALDATMEEGARVTQRMATAQERQAEGLADLRRLLAAGAISQETYQRAVNAAEKETRQATTATNAYRASAGSLSGVMGKLNTVIGLQVAQLLIQFTSAVVGAGRALLRMGNDSQEAIDRLDRLASRTGQSYQDLASLEYAGRLAGVGIEQLATATARADRLFVAAGKGSKQATAAFDSIGLSFEDLNALAPDERFNRIAQAIAALPTPAQQTAASIAIFGRAGAELVPMFQETAGRMAELRAEAERFGLVLSDDQVGGVTQMNDQLDRAYAALQGVVNQVTAGLSPAISAVADLWSGFVASTGGANIGAAVVEALLDGAELVARLFDYAVSVFRPVWDYALSVVNQLGGVSNIWQGLMIVFQSVTLAFQGVVSGLSAVGSAVAAAIYKLMKYVFDGAAYVAEQLGFDGLAEKLKGAAAASNELSGLAYKNMAEAGQQAGANFAGAVDNLWNPEKYGYTMGEAASGTMENTIEEFRARLKNQQAEAAEGVRQAGAGAAEGIAAVVETKLAGALDARSKEGTKEMLRLMFGSNAQQIEQDQLRVQERIADGIDDVNEGLGDLGVEAFAFN